MATNLAPPREPQRAVTLEERRFLLEEQRLQLDRSFARKWLPTLVTVMVGLVAGMFSYASTERARIDARSRELQAREDASRRDEREWGFKVVEMYFDKRDLFSLAKNAAEAEMNLKVLAAVAPKAVTGVLEAEQTRIPAPGAGNDEQRLQSLAAVAGVQSALANAGRPAAQTSAPPPAASLRPAGFTVYVQYAAGGKAAADKTQATLVGLGFKAPGTEQVAKVPSQLEVRYYRPEQRDIAAELATRLGQALGLPAGPANARQLQTSRQLPTGILEVWLPHQP